MENTFMPIFCCKGVCFPFHICVHLIITKLHLSESSLHEAGVHRLDSCWCPGFPKHPESHCRGSARTHWMAGPVSEQITWMEVETKCRGSSEVLEILLQ